MSRTPPLTQFIGRTERTLRVLMDRVLAGTGGTFPQWVALNLTVANGDSIHRRQLSARLANALQVQDTAAEATITELVDEGLLRPVSGSVVALSSAGRERYSSIDAAIDETTGPLFAEIPADDMAAARRVLTTITERANTELAGA